ncbi:type II toxin-antitoxin system VapB family antitoxin [Spiractinospora alimapuensis]|uniref:type II toxin-antitoxin system VapB family antitoxin n=1 Tax=Spiractinospora alimapuensis TaxID=2820884 RepID=UPI001F26A15A|nr:type II toxin-antitoxin system VapB family antitoxin [Spiractinospora alimapuensis]
MLIDIDDQALAKGAEVLGTATKQDTVNAALKDVGERIAKAKAFAELLAMGDRGDFEVLKDKRNYRP